MKKTIHILNNSFYLAFLGAKIDFYTKLLLFIFSKKKLHNLCSFIDRKIEKLRKEFLFIEKRHICINCNS